MKKLFASLLLVFLSSFGIQAQIVFEKGYIITENNEKVECLIKNEDWRYTPSEFEYKLSDSSAVQTGSLASVKEFGINDVYKRFTVQMDRSSDELSNLDGNRSPVMKEETLFLKKTIAGKASLYQYQSVISTRFFFSLDSLSVPEMLVYKRYKTTEGVQANSSYRQQLSNALVCANINQKTFKNMGYGKHEFVRIFIEYNKCSRSVFTEYGKRPKQDLFNLSIKAKVDFSVLSMQQRQQAVPPYPQYTFGHFGNTTFFRPGIEAEIIIPYNKGVWALIIEPSTRKFSFTKEIDRWPATVTYNSRELSFGIRRRFFLKNSSRLFVNAAYMFDTHKNSTLNFGRPEFNDIFEISSLGSVELGAGYNFRNRLNIELRYGMPRKIFPVNNSWASKYQNIALMVGFNIF